jgi:hypothetical protein
MKKINLVLLVVCLVLFIGFLSVDFINAQTLLEDANQQLGEYGESSYGHKDAPYLPTVIGNVINVILSILGILMVTLFIRAGFLYMTAGGDTGKVDTAKKIMWQTVIGLVICLISYMITSFVVRFLTEATYLA